MKAIMSSIDGIVIRTFGGWNVARFMVAFVLIMATVAVSAGRYETVHAGYEPDVWLKCIDTEVSEGDDFRLEVRRKGISTLFSDTMKVYWYTDPITADESDYEVLDREGQASNGYQSRTGKMGRTFHTKDDVYSEIDETFKVRFENANKYDYADDDECIITIKDDEYPGIYDLEIISWPYHVVEWEDMDGWPHLRYFYKYVPGDTIEIRARFTAPVTNVDPETDQPADNTGLYIQVGENRRLATLLRGAGTDTLVFGYTVQEGDEDGNGISVEAGGAETGFYYSGDRRDRGIWAAETPSGRMNRKFHGLDDQSDHKVARELPSGTVIRSVKGEGPQRIADPEDGGIHAIIEHQERLAPELPDERPPHVQDILDHWDEVGGLHTDLSIHHNHAF